MIIAFVGAGGKTSCILDSAKKMSQNGKKVLVTTTTHMEHPSSIGIEGVVDAAGEEIVAAANRKGWVIAGKSCEDSGKIVGLEEPVWKLVLSQVDDVLVEADGAKHFPVKVPAEGEPVIPAGCNRIIVTAGAMALEHPMKKVCFRFIKAQEILRKSGINVQEDALLTVELLGILLQKGYVEVLQKQYPEAEIIVLLNQTDVLKEPEEIQKKLQKEITVPVITYGRNREIHGIYLAAGFSKRFGENKLLFEWNGRPMYLLLLERLEQIKKDRVLQSVTVVTQYDEIIEYLQDREIKTVKNENSILGISSSLKLGLETVQKQWKKEQRREQFYLFSVADQPFLQKQTVQEFIMAFLKSGKGIGCISCKEKMGNPVIFHSRYVPELMKLEGDTGGKRVLKRHMEDVFLFEIQDEKELEDIDRKGLAK